MKLDSKYLFFQSNEVKEEKKLEFLELMEKQVRAYRIHPKADYFREFFYFYRTAFGDSNRVAIFGLLDSLGTMDTWVSKYQMLRDFFGKEEGDSLEAKGVSTLAGGGNSIFTFVDKLSHPCEIMRPPPFISHTVIHIYPAKVESFYKVAQEIVGTLKESKNSLSFFSYATYTGLWRLYTLHILTPFSQMGELEDKDSVLKLFLPRLSNEINDNHLTLFRESIETVESSILSYFPELSP